MRHLSHQVLLAQEEERKDISRELHDEIVQTLTGINVQLASLKIESGASKKSFSKHITYTQRLVEKSVDIVHQFARDLRPTLLDDLGLIPALQTYIKAFAARTGLRVRFLAFAGVEELENDKRTVLYRVALAALVNVAEHAKASNVSVVIKALPQAVLMEITDDGRSFDAAHVLDSRRNKRLGLIGMRERVEMVGGTFRVDSAPGRGTTISAKTSLQDAPEKDDPMKLIKTLLADDHTIVREGLRALLLADSGIEVVGEAHNGHEAVSLAKALHPDVVVMDIAMPVLNGLEATRQILAAAPEAPR